MRLPGKPNSRPHAPPLAAARLFVLLGPLLAVCGCQATPAHPTAEQRRDLGRRAMNLLLRAAQSEDPLLCCNAIEALVQVAPLEGLPRFRAALRSEHPLVCCAGLKALGTVRDKPSHAAIRRHLADPRPHVRLAAAFAAYRCGEHQQARVLVNALNDNPEEKVRAEAARLIGLLEEPRACKRLRAALRVRANEESNIVRLEIYTALARLGDEQALEQLLAHSQHDALSRVLALQSLAELGAPEARDTLLYRLTEKEDYLVHRLIAARGLARLGSNAGYQLAGESTRYVGTNPEDPQEAMRVRSNAALVLGEIGDPRALGVLGHVAETEDDPRVQVAAAYAICQILKR